MKLVVGIKNKEATFKEVQKNIDWVRMNWGSKLDLEKAQGEEEEVDVQALYQGLEGRGFRRREREKKKEESHWAVQILVGHPSQYERKKGICSPIKKIKRDNRLMGKARVRTPEQVVPLDDRPLASFSVKSLNSVKKHNYINHFHD